MTLLIDSLAEVVSRFDAIVLDQWGVLHDGTAPYPRAVETLTALRAAGTRLAVLSNSGKRAAPNAKRIAAMGFPEDLFAFVMTSGEALWRDVDAACVPETRFFPIERAAGDAAAWAGDLDITLTLEPDTAEAILLMGLPDGDSAAHWDAVMDHALQSGKTVYCSNPDRASPRADGRTVISPGALAHAHADAGGHVRFYGKPHRAVFTALETALGTKRLLLVGDSLEHDVAGGHYASWSTALIQNGLYAADFHDSDADTTLARLMVAKSAPAPDYRLEWLQ